MDNDFVQNLAIATYLEAAKRIGEELDARGFTTERLDGAVGLQEKIAEIIQQTIYGNTNYSTEVYSCCNQVPHFECGCAKHRDSDPLVSDASLKALDEKINALRSEKPSFECGCQHLSPPPIPDLPFMASQEPDGWDGDLTNQGLCDENPLKD